MLFLTVSFFNDVIEVDEIFQLFLPVCVDFNRYKLFVVITLTQSDTIAVYTKTRPHFHCVHFHWLLIVIQLLMETHRRRQIHVSRLVFLFSCPKILH